MKNDFQLPKHSNFDTHARIMKMLKSMSDQEFMNTLIKAGIYDKHGKLTKKYRSRP